MPKLIFNNDTLRSMTDPGPGPVVLFDGVCNLCNASVLFVIKRDPRGIFRFAALQSAFAREILVKHNLDPDGLHSIIVVHGSRLYKRSRAALEVVRRLRGLWPILYILIIVPPFIRDWVYDWVASNRYDWFGKKDQCMIPTPELRSRFIG
jgi:predicted DCC family thiol-disulfide oxidoreductase YuxK